MARKLRSLQALRGAAALMVVAHHAFRATSVITPPPAGSILVPPPALVQFGAAGVDVFFVISGFLMTFIAGPYLSGQRSPIQFIVQRAIRIWPPYATVTAVACLLMLGGAWLRDEPLPFDLQPVRLASVVFVPSFDERGLLQPIVGPGWTLNYEALFYASFAAMLLFGRRFALPTLVAIISGLFLMGRMAPDAVAQAFLGDPIVFEFLIGAAIGFALEARWLTERWPGAWLVAAVLLFAILAWLGVEQRTVAYGLPAGALLLSVLGAEPQVRWPGLAVLLGDASYSIYLTHTLVIYHLTSRIDALPAAVMPVGVLLMSGLAVAISAVVGVAFHVAVERPLLRACHEGHHRISRRRAGRAARIGA